MRARRRLALAEPLHGKMPLVSPVLENFADVVERGGGANVSPQHGEVLVAGDVGDLALLDAGGGGRGRVPGAQ